MTATTGRTTAADRKAAEAAAAERAAAEQTGEPELIADAPVATIEQRMPATLAEALSALQGILPRVGKGETANIKSKKGQYSYDYADLGDIVEALMPRLSQVGLSYSAKPTMTRKRGFILKYALRHVSGESDRGWWPLPDPMATDRNGDLINTPQDIGSVITYSRRYALLAITGLAPKGDDDDGKAGSRRRSAGRDSRDERDEQADQPPAPLSDEAAAALVEELKGLIREAGDVETLKEVSRKAVSSGLAEEQLEPVRELYGKRMAEIAEENVKAAGLVSEDQQNAQAPDNAGAQAADKPADLPAAALAAAQAAVADDRAVTDEATDGQTPADARA